MKKYLPSFVSGFGAGVLQVVPVVKMLSCCFIVPIASIASIVLHKKSNNLRIEEVKMSDAVKLGIMTGLVAALFATGFEILITLLSKTNDFIESFPQMQSMITELPFDSQTKQQVIDLLNDVVVQIKQTGFSFLFSINILISNLLINVIFGLFGGLIGLPILKSTLFNKIDSND